MNIILAAMLLATAGCSTVGDNEIVVRESQAPNPNASKVKYMASIRIAGYVDGRSAGNPRKLGVAQVRVSGMSGSDIMLDRDVMDIVADSIHKKLDDSGIQMLAKDDASALFEVSGVIKELKFDAKTRDYVEIKLETTLKEVATGKVVWAGEVEQKTDRYAGVSGNTKSDIAGYLKQQLGIVTGKTSEAINSVLMATRPDLFNLTPGTKVIPGVTVYASPGVGAPVQAAPAAVVPMANDKPLASAANGLLLVITSPARAKVYLDGVFYGMSPLRVEAAPGVHAVEVKLSGFKTASEKVSVRKGDKTELELVLEK
ncbi:MAG TPA: PEGA domain-containing protein [Sideroxyarcus sp.]|nr:PEGA domain-containing protein [Sideroxyarcus sp.]